MKGRVMPVACSEPHISPGLEPGRVGQAARNTLSCPYLEVCLCAG